LKRIIICFDGTFDDTGDTPERTKPGSSVSRLCRWILPPLLWQILWVLRVFAVFKWIEHGLLGLGPTAKGKSVTNASLLSRAIKPLGHRIEKGGNQQHIHQITFYIGGIGALGNPQSRVEEAVTGNTMTYKVRYAYQLLVDNYRAGDEIFLFGFSRGAFAARAIAEFISHRGISKKGAIADFDNAWADFTRPDQPSNSLIINQSESQVGKKTIDEDDKGSGKVPIRCVGVWDTVGSLGPPPLFFVHRDELSIAHAAHKRHGQFDIGLKPKADYAFHALALDERRFDFYPAVWFLPDIEQHPERYCQTWFSGVHKDTGGGSLGGLSQYALIWMISKVQGDNLLQLDDEYIQAAIIKPIEDAPPPWDLVIRGRDYVERLMPWLGFLPQRIKDTFRTAHRNPYISVASTDGIQRDVSLCTHSKLHWSVIERTRRSKGAYWASCPALRKGDPANARNLEEKNVQERMEHPIGKDLELMQHFIRHDTSRDVRS
jgi:hypothetical protein